jgi:fibrillarin-like pre-rRNA processing protein
MSSLLQEDRRGRTVLLTRNLTPGKRVYNEDLVLKGGVEYRTWDPFRSKLAAAIIKGLSPNVIVEGSKVLYLGVSTGTTASHVSDIVGPSGVVVGVEFAPRVAREFVERVARQRSNVIPFVADAHDPSKYSVVKVDVVYCDVAQPDQTEIAILNSKGLLKAGGCLLLVLKSQSIDVTKEPKLVYEEERTKLQNAGLEIIGFYELSPFEKHHAMVWARI